MAKGKAAEVSLFVFRSAHELHTDLSIPWHLDPYIKKPVLSLSPTETSCQGCPQKLATECFPGTVGDDLDFWSDSASVLFLSSLDGFC